MTRQERFQALAALCRHHDVAALYAFGSRGREVLAWLQEGAVLAGGASDADLGARPVPGTRLTVEGKVRLGIACEDLLGCARVDLVVLPEADPFVAAEVIRGERLYCRDEYEADEYDLYILRRVGDLAPLEQERLTLILGARA